METTDYLQTTPSPPRWVQDLMRIRPYVRQTGNEIRGRWKLPRRRLMDYLLVYVGTGRGFFKLDRKGYTMNPGDLFLVPPDTPHEMTGTMEMECVYVHFDLFYHPERSHWDARIPGHIEELGTARVLISDREDKIENILPAGKLSPPNHKRIRSLLQQICLENSRGGADSALIVSGLMTTVIGELLRFSNHETPVEPAIWQCLEKAMEELQRQITGHLDLHKAAALTGFSLSHFRRIFGSVYGQSPRSMHRTLKIQKARELLYYSTMNISEISDHLGFSTVQNFSRAFREITGDRPTVFRRNLHRLSAVE